MPNTDQCPAASGVFETLAVINGKPRWPARHLARLLEGCRRLRIDAPPEEVLRDALHAQAALPGTGVVKITVTGNAPAAAGPAQWTVRAEPPRLRPAEWGRDGVSIITCRTRWPSAPQYAGLKLLDRSAQVQARQEWSAEYVAEGLMLDADGCLVSGTMTNVYAVIDDVVCTPALVRCGVAGTMRAALLEAWKARGRAVAERDMNPFELIGANEIFLSNALIGVWPVRALDGRVYEVGAVAREAATWLQSQLP
jgi:4-amino-4-deoxychorismate lyase